MSFKIKNADFREAIKNIPDRSVDLIFTDPPYGLDYNKNDLAANREKAFGGKLSNMGENPIMNDGEEEAFELFEHMLVEAKRILKKGACCCCCCCGGGPKPLFARWSLMMDKAIGFKHAVVWDKGGLGMGMQFRRNYEFVLIAQNGAPTHRWNGGRSTPNVIRIGKIIPRKDQHPTQKPVRLMGEFIKLFSNPGDTVLDPFMGSGSTGVASLKLDRDFIGYELDPKFFEMAKKRLAKEQKQAKLFVSDGNEKTYRQAAINF